VHSLRKLLSNCRSRRKAHLALAFLAITNHVSFVALAAAPAGVVSSAPHPAAAACAQAIREEHCPAAFSDGLQVSLPDGAQPCPGSGDGAACVTSAGSPKVAAGVASTPAGLTACPSDSSISSSTPAACIDTTPFAASQSGTPGESPIVSPSVPIASLQPAAAHQKLSLSASASAMQAGQGVVLTATAPASVSATGTAIEIFDTTAGTLVAACSQGTQCSVAYAAETGVHNFSAYITRPTSTVPTGSVLTSSSVAVGWIGLTLKAVNVAAGPGKAMLVTAASTIPADQFGYAIEIFDLSNMNRVTYCSHGTNCSVSLSQPSSGGRSLVAAVGRPTSKFSNPDIWAVSDHLALTWLSIAIGGSSTFQVGGAVHINATANADLTNTPWSIGIFDDKGNLVGTPCKTGSSCSANVSVTSSATPRFTAAIGAVPPTRNLTKLGQVLQKVTGPTSLVDIQVRSAEVQPSRILWGVDSCKAFTGDPSGSELFSSISSSLGQPDFWGRYLTSTVCPGLSWPEIYLAAKAHMGILPIYNDYNCSSVSGYDTGMGYAQVATGVAAHDGVPQGRVIAIDIEPPGEACPGAVSVDSGFIRGWYDGVRGAGYVALFYGNGTGGSEFGSAWCQAQSEVPALSTTAFIWSFEPSLVAGSWSKSNAPVWQPYQTGCPDYVAAWQYQIGGNAPNSDIDGDEALSDLPLWYPS